MLRVAFEFWLFLGDMNNVAERTSHFFWTVVCGTGSCDRQRRAYGFDGGNLPRGPRDPNAEVLGPEYFTYNGFLALIPSYLDTWTFCAHLSSLTATQFGGKSGTLTWTPNTIVLIVRTPKQGTHFLQTAHVSSLTALGGSWDLFTTFYYIGL